MKKRLILATTLAFGGLISLSAIAAEGNTSEHIVLQDTVKKTDSSLTNPSTAPLPMDSTNTRKPVPSRTPIPNRTPTTTDPMKRPVPSPANATDPGANPTSPNSTSPGSPSSPKTPTPPTTSPTGSTTNLTP